MKKMMIVVVLIALVSSVFADGGYQELDWGISLEELIAERPEVTELSTSEEMVVMYSSGVVAGYDSNVVFMISSQFGLVSVMVEFTETIDESMLTDALESKYVEIDSNWFDWYLYADRVGSITETYIELNTPMWENAYLWYVIPSLYESIKESEDKELEQDL